MISAKHFSTATNYKVVDVVTMHDNDIKAHFVEYVERYVNVVWNKNDALADIKASDASIEEKKTQSICAYDYVTLRQTFCLPTSQRHLTRLMISGSMHKALT